MNTNSSYFVIQSALFYAYNNTNQKFQSRNVNDTKSQFSQFLIITHAIAGIYCVANCELHMTQLFTVGLSAIIWTNMNRLSSLVFTAKANIRYSPILRYITALLQAINILVLLQKNHLHHSCRLSTCYQPNHIQQYCMSNTNV